MAVMAVLTSTKPLTFSGEPLTNEQRKRVKLFLSLRKKKHAHTHKCDRRKTRNLFFFKPFSLVPSDGRVFFIFLLRFFIFAPNPSTVTAMATGESFERETREISGGGQRRNRTRNAPISASIMAEPIFDVSFFFYLIRSVSRPRFPREPRTCYVFFYFIH